MKMKIVSNCPLCEEKALHVIGDEGTMITQQCINCGYATTDRFVGTIEDNETLNIPPNLTLIQAIMHMAKHTIH